MTCAWIASEIINGLDYGDEETTGIFPNYSGSKVLISYADSSQNDKILIYEKAGTSFSKSVEITSTKKPFSVDDYCKKFYYKDETNSTQGIAYIEDSTLIDLIEPIPLTNKNVVCKISGNGKVFLFDDILNKKVTINDIIPVTPTPGSSYVHELSSREIIYNLDTSDIRKSLPYMINEPKDTSDPGWGADNIDTSFIDFNGDTIGLSFTRSWNTSTQSGKDTGTVIMKYYRDVTNFGEPTDLYDVIYKNEDISFSFEGVSPGGDIIYGSDFDTSSTSLEVLTTNGTGISFSSQASIPSYTRQSFPEVSNMIPGSSVVNNERVFSLDLSPDMSSMPFKFLTGTLYIYEYQKSSSSWNKIPCAWKGSKSFEYNGVNSQSLSSGKIFAKINSSISILHKNSDINQELEDIDNDLFPQSYNINIDYQSSKLILNNSSHRFRSLINPSNLEFKDNNNHTAPSLFFRIGDSVSIKNESSEGLIMVKTAISLDTSSDLLSTGVSNQLAGPGQTLNLAIPNKDILYYCYKDHDDNYMFGKIIIFPV